MSRTDAHIPHWVLGDGCPCLPRGGWSRGDGKRWRGFANGVDRMRWMQLRHKLLTAIDTEDVEDDLRGGKTWRRG